MAVRYSCLLMSPTLTLWLLNFSVHCSYSTLVLQCMWRGWEQIICVFSSQVVSQTEMSCTQVADPEDLNLPMLTYIWV